MHNAKSCHFDRKLASLGFTDLEFAPSAQGVREFALVDSTGEVVFNEIAEVQLSDEVLDRCIEIASMYTCVGFGTSLDCRVLDHRLKIFDLRIHFKENTLQQLAVKGLVTTSSKHSAIVDAISVRTLYQAMLLSEDVISTNKIFDKPVGGKKAKKTQDVIPKARHTTMEKFLENWQLVTDEPGVKDAYFYPSKLKINPNTCIRDTGDMKIISMPFDGN